MDKEENKTFRDLLSIDKASPATQTLANVIGGAIFGGGLYGAFTNQPKSYEYYTKNEQSRISEIGSAFGAKADTEVKAFESDLAGYTKGTLESVESGLGARGITDSAVAKEASQKTTKGLSGAYSAARNALARAKVKATSAMDISRANYMQELVQKQYNSMLENYYGKMGVWGALGGAGTSLMLKKDKPTTDNKEPSGSKMEYKNFIVDPMEPKFKMKGVK